MMINFFQVQRTAPHIEWGQGFMRTGAIKEMTTGRARARLFCALGKADLSGSHEI